MPAPTPTLSRAVHYVELDQHASDVVRATGKAVHVRHATVIHVHSDGSFGLRVHRLGQHGGDYEVQHAVHDETNHRLAGTFHYPPQAPRPEAPVA